MKKISHKKEEKNLKNVVKIFEKKVLYYQL